ncbi:serine hydrolase [Streptomyces sp. NPDC047002]|uniref:D-alanyl-D-alanine carboxypeptidase n=1 Tax=Streptomyces sp. NPDC047002 TaxID=3155475 RepID=UPI00345513C7
MAGESPGKSEQHKASGETGPDEREAGASGPEGAANVAEANTEAESDAEAAITAAPGAADATAAAGANAKGARAAGTTVADPGPAARPAPAPADAEPSDTGAGPAPAGAVPADTGAGTAKVPDARSGGADAGRAPTAPEAEEAAPAAASKPPASDEDGPAAEAPEAATAAPKAPGADASGTEAPGGKPSAGGPDTPKATAASASGAQAAAPKTPGRKAPGAKSSGGDAPGAETPDTQAPGGKPSAGEAGAAKAPAASASGAQAAAPKTPGRKAPGAKTSGGDAPGAETPDTQAPGGKPSAGGPDTPKAPAASASGAQAAAPKAPGRKAPGAKTSGGGAPGTKATGAASAGGGTAGTKPSEAPSPEGGDADAKGSGGSGTKASGGGAPAPKGSGGKEASGGGAPGPKGSGGKAGGAAGAEGGVDRATTALRRGVDQPTTAIRAVSVPGAAAQRDQPTTALKLPDAPALNKRGGVEGSTFVPLKRDDAAGAEGAASGGPITPVIDPERTAQQPVPPKDPLDLLAELTNTPDTPVRVVVRRFKIWTPLVVLLAIVYVVVQAVRPLPAPSLKLTASATYSFAGKKPQLPWPSEGQGYLAAPGLGTMDSFGKETPVPVGSVAKMMTAYLVLKDHPLKTGAKGPSIPVDKQAEQEGGLDSEGESTLNTIKAGDKLSLKDALSALMIPSANNVARLLARWDAGSEAAFVKKMNAEAKSLGMDHTTYTDPSGLKSSTVSTAKDQVALGQKLVGIPALTAITVLPQWTDPSGHTWRNYNTLVPYNGAIGLKTGTTNAAGGNLVFAAHKVVDGKDQLVVGAIFGQHKPAIIDTVNEVSKTALLAAEGELKRAAVVRKGQVVGEVDDGMGGTVPVVATADAKAVGWGGLTEKLALDNGSTPVPHEAKAGTRVGTLTVGNGLSSTKIPVALQRDLAEPGLGAKLTHF